MSNANPVETKADPAPANPAAALSAPAPATPAAGGGLWAKLVRHKTVGLAVGGSALVLASGWYGLTHFSPAPPPAVAQTAEPGATPPDKTEELPKRTDPTPESALDITVPSVNVVSTDGSPATRPTGPDPLALKPPPMPDPDPKLAPRPVDDIRIPDPPNIPNTKPGTRPADEIAAPEITAPLVPGADLRTKADPTTKPVAGDPFKAPGELADPDRKKPTSPATGPAPLATDMGERKEKSDVPVITIGGLADPPVPPGPKDEITVPLPPDLERKGGPDRKADPMGPPPVPKLDLDLPPVPAPDRSDGPPTVTAPRSGGDRADVVKPPAALDKKDEGLPTLVIPTRPGPSTAGPKKDDASTLPKIDLTAPDPVKPPAGPADPPAGPAAGPLADPKKKDAFDEDWHTPRPGESVETVNYSEISREYYKSPDFAQALRAYNKDRRRGDGVIRVPPPWVLKERFPNLVLTERDDRPAGPEAKPTSNVKFEAAVAPAPGSRAAPPPAIGRSGSNDEYRVTAPDGEMIREVARKVLGDANGWRRIASLNPDLDPTLPIPAGTTLRLPR